MVLGSTTIFTIFYGSSKEEQPVLSMLCRISVNAWLLVAIQRIFIENHLSFLIGGDVILWNYIFLNVCPYVAYNSIKEAPGEEKENIYGAPNE